MTREHIYFIPFIFALGLVVGALVTRDRAQGATAGGRGVLVAGLVLLLAFVATHALAMHGGARQVEELLAGQPLFDQRPAAGADEVHDRIARFGSAGRDAYRRMTYTTDLVFPLALLHFLVRIARHAAGAAAPRSPMARRIATLVPFLWIAADLVENAIIHHLLGVFPHRDDRLAGVLGPVTDAKFALLVASVAVPAMLLLRRPPRSPRDERPGQDDALGGRPAT